VGKAQGPNDIPNRAVNHLPQRAISLLVTILNAALLAQFLPAVWKHDRIISILKPGKDPALLSSYRPINLLDNIGKFSENTILSSILSEVRGRVLLRDEQFGFRTKHSNSLQLVRPVETVTRNFGEKRLTGVVFLDVAKAFDTVCVYCLLVKLRTVNFPSYLVKTIFSYLHNRTLEAYFQTATPTVVACRLAWRRGD
jgi:hypothetical protein